MVEIVAENPFKGFTGSIVKEIGDNVEIQIKSVGGIEFTYVGKMHDVKVIAEV